MTPSFDLVYVATMVKLPESPETIRAAATFFLLAGIALWARSLWRRLKDHRPAS